MISNAIPFTNPNREAFERLTEKQKSNPASYPQGDPELRSFRAIGDMSEQVEALYNELRFNQPPRIAPTDSPNEMEPRQRS